MSTFKVGDKVVFNQACGSGFGPPPPGKVFTVSSITPADALVTDHPLGGRLHFKETSQWGYEAEFVSVIPPTEDLKEQLKNAIKHKAEVLESEDKVIAKLESRIRFTELNGGVFDVKAYLLWATAQEVRSAGGDDIMLATRLSSLLK